MAEQRHGSHPHQHARGCEHPAIAHEGHVDYLHDGHLHHVEHEHVIECLLKEDAANPAACTPQHACGEHAGQHAHGSGCGHLHHPHGNHCDNHGAVKSA